MIKKNNLYELTDFDLEKELGIKGCNKYTMGETSHFRIFLLCDWLRLEPA